MDINQQLIMTQALSTEYSSGRLATAEVAAQLSRLFPPERSVDGAAAKRAMDTSMLRDANINYTSGAMLEMLHFWDVVVVSGESDKLTIEVEAQSEHDAHRILARAGFSVLSQISTV